MVKALIPDTERKGFAAFVSEDARHSLEVSLSLQRTGNNLWDGESGDIAELGLGQTGQNARQVAAFVDPRKCRVQVACRLVARDVNELFGRKLL